MIKELTYRSLSLLMAFLVFTSSVSFAIDIHYCGGQIKSINFFGEAQSCHKKVKEIKESAKGECCSNENNEYSQCEMKSEKKECCHNEQFVFEQDNDSKLFDKSTVSIEEISPVLVYILISQHFFEFETKPTFYSYYDPPPLHQNILVQHQVFRI